MMGRGVVGFRVSGARFKAWGLGFRASYFLGFTVQSLGVSPELQSPQGPNLKLDPKP